MKRNFLYLILMTGFLLTSCKEDVSPPTIVLNNPTEFSISALPGDSILFEGIFTDPNELGMLDFVQKNFDNSQTVLKSITSFDSQKEHNFVEGYIVNPAAIIGEVYTVGFIGYDVPGNNTQTFVDITIE